MFHGTRRRFTRSVPWGAAFLLACLAMVAPAAKATVDDSGTERILGRDASGAPTFLQGALGYLNVGQDPAAEATRFLSELARDDFAAGGNEELEAFRVSQDDLGLVHVRLRQTIGGLPVLGTHMIVHSDALTGEVYAVNGRFVSSLDVETKPAMEAAEALERATMEAGISGKALDDGQLVYVLGSDDRPYLAWRQRIRYQSEDGLEMDDIFAEAATGALVARHPKIHRAKSWKTYEQGAPPPGTLRCTNNQSCGGSVLQNIHNGASSVYDYYKAKFGRSSYNGSDVTISSIGHVGVNYNNASWNGVYLEYGDGDGSQFGPLGNAFDIVAHEFTHAVTDYESNLVYQNESGALNEAWSDIFGATAEAWADGGINVNTWKVGEDAYTPSTGGDALRYMNNPTQDGISKDYYPERYTGSADSGGVHRNSGIANLAFYLMVNGGSHPRGKTSVSVPSMGLTRAEQIFYRAQTTYLTSSSNFTSARTATGQAAQDLYGSTYRDYVYLGWCAVGVGSCPAAPNSNALFISQSVPSSMAPGQTATVSVTMKNTGNTTWTRNDGYKLGSQNPQDNTTWGMSRVLLPTGVSVAPQQQRTFTFTITAPTSPGTYNFRWRMVHEFVAWFGAYAPNKQINVSAGVDNAQYVSQSVPTSMNANQYYSVSVTMKNTGTSTWTRTVDQRLGSENPRDNTHWGLSRVALPNGVSVAPGQNYTFTFVVRAPSTPGTYNFQWRMVHIGVAWFGGFSQNRQIVVQ